MIIRNTIKNILKLHPKNLCLARFCNIPHDDEEFDEKGRRVIKVSAEELETMKKILSG